VFYKLIFRNELGFILETSLFLYAVAPKVPFRNDLEINVFASDTISSACLSVYGRGAPVAHRLSEIKIKK
jgi:hypothetical protein